MRRMISVGILICVIVSLTAFGVSASATDLMPGAVSEEAADAVEVTEPVAMDAGNGAVTDLSVRLLQECIADGTGENTLLSPISILTALAMTANGAEGETLAQMESVFGIDLEELDQYLSTFPQQDALWMADSIWIRDDDDLTVNEDFLETNAAYFGANVFSVPFDDATLTDINDWVADNTDGMIEKMLDEIPEEAIMYLLNAVSFEAGWEDPYTEYDVYDGEFTLEDGTTETVDMMSSTENFYLEDEEATGFLKFYEGDDYALAVLLPNEGVTLSDYIASLTGEELQSILDGAVNTTVFADMPKFEYSYETELSEALTDLGMVDLFDMDLADLSGIGGYPEKNLYVSQVLHKTFISVDENGTSAGAATAVEIMLGSAGGMTMDYKTVTLDRPFLYMIIDCSNNVPIFIGTVMDPLG